MDKTIVKRICPTCNDEYVQQEVGYISKNMFVVTNAFLIDNGSCINVKEEHTYFWIKVATNDEW